MFTQTKQLLNILELKKLNDLNFEGESISIGSKRVFGGQVIAQAVNAATRTVDTDRNIHSLHCYFVLPGDVSKPIFYNVELVRDGRSFTTRRVMASQNDKVIFVLAASFQKEQDGPDHQIEMLNVPPPDSLSSIADQAEVLGKKFNFKPSGIFSSDGPIDFRPVEKVDPLNPGKRPPFSHVWFKSKDKLPADFQTHTYVMSYASDFNLLFTALLPHNISVLMGQVKLASLDHAMWFHRKFKADEWLLYAIESPSASNARGFCRGSIFTQEGILVASVTQEGLMRVRK